MHKFWYNIGITFCILMLVAISHDKGNINILTEVDFKFKKISLNEAIENCQKILKINECAIENIQNEIRDKSVTSNDSDRQRAIVWTTDNKLINLFAIKDSEFKLITSSLNSYQLIVWEAYLNQSRNDSYRGEIMTSNSVVATGIIILIIVGLILLVYILLPLIWKFFLRRISEVSKAAKGEKIE